VSKGAADYKKIKLLLYSGVLLVIFNIGALEKSIVEK
jgi:hypothetical protein